MLNLRQASLALGKPQNYLANLRYERKWPEGVKIVRKGGKAGYLISESDLEAFKEVSRCKVIYSEASVRKIADKLQQAGYLSAASWLRKNG